MKNRILIFLVSVFLSSCSGRNSVPRRILQPSKMQAVIWDMVKADQYINNYANNNDSGFNKRAESIKLYQEIFRIHNISKEKFNQSFKFYRTHPRLLNIVLDSINARAYNAPTEIFKPSRNITAPQQSEKPAQ
ncbi:MAG: DUF4296 domain-containing protein [Bacteroidota bacterium]